MSGQMSEGNQDRLVLVPPVLLTCVWSNDCFNKLFI